MLLGDPRGLSQGAAPTTPRVPGWPGQDWAEEEAGAPPARRGQLSTCRHRRAPESAMAPRPLLFVTARLPVCGRQPQLTSRAGKPPKAASFSGTLPLGPASCLLRVPPLAREPARGRSRGKREPRAGGAAGRQGRRGTLEGAARLSLWRLRGPHRTKAGSALLSSGSNWKEPKVMLSSRYCPDVQKARPLHLLKPSLRNPHHLLATTCRWSFLTWVEESKSERV